MVISIMLEKEIMSLLAKVHSRIYRPIVMSSQQIEPVLYFCDIIDRRGGRLAKYLHYVIHLLYRLSNYIWLCYGCVTITSPEHEKS